MLRGALVSLTAGLLLSVPLSRAAAGGPAEPAPADKVEFFEQRIRPLLIKQCYSCHSAGAKKLRGELLLDTRDGVRKGGATGPALIPGRPDDSLLIKAVRYEVDLRMPPQTRLAAQEIADLVAWVK